MKRHANVQQSKNNNEKGTARKRPNLANHSAFRGESTPSSSKFVIPRKKTETSLFTEISLDSRRYKDDIWPILKRYSTRTSNNQEASKFKYTKCTLVNNDALVNQFEAKRREMKATLSHGFWQVFNKEEVKTICERGLSANHRFGTLGRPDLGVYVSKYSDVLTAAPLLDGSTGTLIIFNILKGRSKIVPSLESGHLEPSPNFDCHVARSEVAASTSDAADQTPYRLFESSLLYLYDYVDVDIQMPPRSVCPIAVVEYVYEDQPNSPRWLHSDLHVWTGGLRFEDKNCGGGDLETNLRMMSHLAKMKPPHLGRHILVKKLVTSEACLQYGPVKDLRSGTHQGQLYKHRRDLRLASGRYVSIFRLTQSKQSDKYSDLIATMYKHDLVGLSSLHEGTALLVFPASHFSCLLGIPALRGSSLGLYCLVLSYRSLVTGTGFVRDPYESSTHDSALADSYIANPMQLLTVNRDYVEKYSQLQEVVEEGDSSPPPTTTKRTPAVTFSFVIDDDNNPSSLSDQSSVAVANCDHQHPNIPEVIVATPPDKRPTVDQRALLRDPRLQRRLKATTTHTTDNNGPSSSTSSTNHLRQCKVEGGGAARRQTPRSAQSGGGNHQEEEAVWIDRDTEAGIWAIPSVVPAAATSDKSSSSSSRVPVDSSSVNSRSTLSVTSGSAPVIKKRRTANGAPQNPLNTVVMKVIYGEKMKKKNDVEVLEKARVADSKNATHQDTSDQRSTATRADNSESSEVNFRTTTVVKREVVTPQSTPPPVASNQSPIPISIKGTVVPDDLVLIRADPAEVRLLLDRFEICKAKGKGEWKLQLHSQVVLKLANIKKNLSAGSLQHNRATDMLSLFTRYRIRGFVDLLREHECDKRSRSAAEYLPCLQQLKGEQAPEHKFILMSNLNPSSEVAKSFQVSNISVMNLQTLLQEFLDK